MRGDRLGDLDHAGLDQHGGDADGAVAAHRQAAGHLDEDHAPVAVRPGRRLQDRAAHRGVAARLVHQQRAQVVHLGHEVLPPLGHGGAGDDADAAGDDPGRHALGVGVDRVERTDRAHQLSPAASAFSVASRIDRGVGVGQRATRRPAAPAVDRRRHEIHRQLDRLDELGLRVPAQQRVQLAVQRHRGVQVARRRRRPRGRRRPWGRRSGSRRPSPASRRSRARARRRRCRPARRGRARARRAPVARRTSPVNSLTATIRPSPCSCGEQLRDEVDLGVDRVVVGHDRQADLGDDAVVLDHVAPSRRGRSSAAAASPRGSRPRRPARRSGGPARAP